MRARSLIILLLAALAGPLVLAGCGAKGDPYVPGVYDKNGKPVQTTTQPPVKDRHFILDPLIQ
ncbi:hypothetical protein [Pararhizobium mangrovi]|uniref:Lipoprotein n=1 Tax=Pararhizobium mangrovi TaxID=2590452 RepID=A0A506U414_9HYPH|nr:hypothetical protein [Pararhizobium mangrovi]TPW27289.1 hypothetical protein FJU11_12105 [Pararhizobium mangrovi]